MDFTLAIILATLVGLSASINGSTNGERLHVTIRADPPLSGPICVDKTVDFTCLVFNEDRLHQYQYQWSIDGDTPKIGNQSFTLQVTSRSATNVTCEVYARQNGGTKVQYGANGVTVQPNGTIPQIYFQHVTHNFVYKLAKRPFNLTAIVLSDSNLTSLYWSPPSSVPLPNRTMTVHHGNITTTTLILLKNASLGDSSKYTLTAVNECGQSSSIIDVDVLTACPEPKFREVYPQNFTAVDNYNATLKCSFDGRLSLESSLRMWVLFPGSQTPVYLDSFPYSDCGCWVENKLACSNNTNPNDCCKFEFIMHSTPRLDDSGTIFSCTGNFTKKDTSWMFVVPSPKVLEPPRNVISTVGSKAVFTCNFEAATDNKISQIHWLFNGNDLAGCSRFKDSINCTVTQQSTDKNYISSTLTIYPVQADNAGQYTCYCSYNTSLLNVDGVQVIESDHKSATLSVQSDSSPEESSNTFIIVFGIVFGVVAIFLLLGSLIYCFRVHNRKYMGYIPLEQDQLSGDEIKDEMLERYVTDKLFPLWEKFGKALKLSSSFLEKAYSDYPTNPAERLRAILREWRATADYPSLSTLDKILEQLGLANIIPQ